MKVDLRKLGLRQRIRQCAPREGRQILRGTIGANGIICTLAGQHQQLVHELDGPLDTLVQPGDRQRSGRLVRGPAECLGLHLQRGQRRAQLVGRMGHKRFLGVESGLHAGKQQIQFIAPAA